MTCLFWLVACSKCTTPVKFSSTGISILLEPRTSPQNRAYEERGASFRQKKVPEIKSHRLSSQHSCLDCVFYLPVPCARTGCDSCEVPLALLLSRTSEGPWFHLAQGCCPSPEEMSPERVAQLFSREVGKDRIGPLGPAGQPWVRGALKQLCPSPRYLRASCVLEALDIMLWPGARSLLEGERRYERFRARSPGSFAQGSSRVSLAGSPWPRPQPYRTWTYHSQEGKAWVWWELPRVLRPTHEPMDHENSFQR